MELKYFQDAGITETEVSYHPFASRTTGRMNLGAGILGLVFIILVLKIYSGAPWQNVFSLFLHPAMLFTSALILFTAVGLVAVWKILQGAYGLIFPNQVELTFDGEQCALFRRAGNKARERVISFNDIHSIERWQQQGVAWYQIIRKSSDYGKPIPVSEYFPIKWQWWRSQTKGRGAEFEAVILPAIHRIIDLT